MAKQPYNLSKLSILIVDDNKHIRSLINSILGALGVKNIKESIDGESAFKEIKDFNADIIICDWNMQPMDGIEFTHKVRNDINSPNIYAPIIMLTGHSSKDHVIKARDAGVHEFIAKPFTVQSLYARIQAIIERPRSFVRIKGNNPYFGPDRRRKQLDEYGCEDRRKIVSGA